MGTVQYAKIICSLAILLSSLASTANALGFADDDGIRTLSWVVQGGAARYRVSLSPAAPELIGPPTAAEIAKLQADALSFAGLPWVFVVNSWVPQPPPPGGCVAGLEPPGDYRVGQNDAAIGVLKQALRDPPGFTEVSWVTPEQLVHANWIQFVHTTHPLPPPPAAPEPNPTVDPTWWDHDGQGRQPYVRDFEDNLPYYWTWPEALADTVIGPNGGTVELRFSDRPFRGLADAPVNWEAHLYLVAERLADTDMDGSPDQTQVCFANKGVKWGFKIEIVGPGAVVAGTWNLGGAGGDKFEEVLFNPPDFGVKVPTVPVGGTLSTIDPFGVLAPYLIIAGVAFAVVLTAYTGKRWIGKAL